MVKDYTQASRLYPTVTPAGTTKWVTRDIAALDFLLGIPLFHQGESVRHGWERQGQPNATGKWWERYVANQTELGGEGGGGGTTNATVDDTTTNTLSDIPKPTAVLLGGPSVVAATTRGGGRRLEGDTATKLQIPKAGEYKSTRQRYIARQAQVREWERQVAQDVLGGRIFFSAKDNYPVSVFSVIKYEPKREEAARRRQKLEARGGGGTQFVVPERDWRGTSYRALLPRRRQRKLKGFNRFLDAKNTKNDDDSSSESSSSEEEDTYAPGFLDDPEMRQGRHRHVMIGDRVSGCIVSSTIQFVKPAELKAELNKQFRERFDGWEPPQSQRKYIGAKIIDGVYTFVDSKEESEEEETIRMPPSLTLSKIRSAKQQIMLAAIHDASLEVSTVALAFVYFERLCLDCRVDKSNRRLSFAACLLLAAKINESNLTLLVHREDEEQTGLQSLIRPTRESSTIFASLLEFFTHDWGLSLKHLFSAEWGVFAALGFRLHASPSQVEFHFRRIMKVLGWNAFAYLGHEMYTQWQDCVETVEERERERVSRREMRREQKERKLLKLEIQRQIQEKEWEVQDEVEHREAEKDHESPHKPKQQMIGMKLLHRITIGLARPSAMERTSILDRSSYSAHEPTQRRPSLRPPTRGRSNSTDRTATTPSASRTNSLMMRSPSLPLLADQSQNSAPVSPGVDHVAIYVSDEGADNHDQGNSSSADGTAYDEEGGIY